MDIRSTSGQVLVLILLVVLVAMTVGLSVASRTLTTVRNQAELTQSNRAFSAAEAGVERALLMLRDSGAGSCDGNACSSQIDGVETQVHVSQVGNSNDAYYSPSLAQDTVFPVNLEGYSGSSLTLYWGNKEDVASQGGACPNQPALLVTLLYKRGGEYGVGKTAIDPCKSERMSAGSDDNGFVALSESDKNPSDTVALHTGNSLDNFAYKRSVNLFGVSGLATTGDEILSLRVRFMYAGDKQLAVKPGGGVLPVQGQYIVSSAIVGGQQRTVKVLRATNPEVPAIFDYALFNGSTSTLSK